MKSHITLPLLIVFLITCLARSVATEFSNKQPQGLPAATIPIRQNHMIWHYYQGETDTPWILVQKQNLAGEAYRNYYGGFEMNNTPKNLLGKLHATCPHNKNRCVTYYVAKARGFTTPRALLKGKDFEWVKVRDITTSTNPDNGVWAHTRNNNMILMCPMLVQALRSNEKPA